MSILCKLFGHKSSEHVYSGGEYMKVCRDTIDGIGREHARLYARCPRCEKTYRAGMIHLIQRDCDRVAGSAMENARDAGRYCDLRSLLYGQDVVIDEATLIFKVTGQCPTIEEFDAGVDSAIAAAKGE